MSKTTIHTWIEWTSQGVEVFAVLVIVVAVTYGAGRYLVHFSRRRGDSYERYKIQLSKALLVGLELLVAADIIETVLLKPTLQEIAVLGLLIMIRTFLSWSLVVEMEGRWPWQGRDGVK